MDRWRQRGYAVIQSTLYYSVHGKQSILRDENLQEKKWEDDQ